MNEDLKHRCEALPIRDKFELREYLSRLIEAEANPIGKSPLRCSMLMEMMAEVMGLSRIDYFSRESSQVWARTMVVYQMILEGYNTMEVGAQMMKDHSTISCLTKKMRGVFDTPRAFRDIVNIWNTFQNRLQNETIISRSN